MSDPVFQVKQLFFDSQKVIKALDAGKRAALSKVGAFMRTRMKSLTKNKSKNRAKPGRPPNRHSGELHNLIYFSYDDINKEVDTGPVKFKDGEAPALLEKGGIVTRLVKNNRGRTRKFIRKTLKYAGNPFAGPSLDAEIAAGTIPKEFEGIVKTS